MTKRVLFLTGTRADFGKMKPLIEAVEGSKDFEAYLFVTGMHMLGRYGSTVNEVYKAGFRNVFGHINQDGSVNSQMDIALANTIQGLGHYVREFPPDLMIVHGDRIEAMAGAVVGALRNILVGHIEGGEVSGTVDELIRHAVTKMSHLHFVSTSDALRRLVQMGERPESVFVIGSPDVDVMLSDGLPSLAEVKERYGIEFEEYGILAYHPVTTEVDRLPERLQQLCEAVVKSGFNFVAVYPNNDVGSDLILAALRSLEGHPRFRLIPSMRFEFFLTLLKHTRVVVGNSSIGIREAPVYGIPVINIGTRQLNRFTHPTIKNVSDDRDAILDALRDLPGPGVPSFHFGDGDSVSRFMKVLRGPNLWDTPRQKQFQDRVLVGEFEAALPGV